MPELVQVNVMTAISLTVLQWKVLVLRKKIRVGTWNVRSLYQGKHHIVEKEMKRTEIDILGICEHRWSGQGHFKTLTGGMYIY